MSHDSAAKPRCGKLGAEGASHDLKKPSNNLHPETATAPEAAGRIPANENFDRTAQIHPGHRLYSSADTLRELLTPTPGNSYKSRGTVVEWREGKRKRVGGKLISQPGEYVRKRRNADAAVFDVAQELPTLVDEKGDWTPPKAKALPGVPVFRCGSDGPSTEHRIKASQAWYSSGRYSGQHANDNKDWPLAKLLRAENNEHCLALAERYRAMFDAANEPCELVGKDVADNVYIMTDLRLDSSTGKLADKGAKKVTGKKARLNEPAARAVKADPDKSKKRAKAVPKKWNGDWPLLHKIDTSCELADAQTALGWLREAFEAAVCGGETLEAIGREHGVGNQAGAKGAGRALVYLGLQCIDEFWGKPARRAA